MNQAQGSRVPLLLRARGSLEPNGAQLAGARIHVIQAAIATRQRMFVRPHLVPGFALVGQALRQSDWRAVA